MTSQVGEVSQGGAYQGQGRARTEAVALVSSVALPFCSEVMKGGLVLGKVSVGRSTGAVCPRVHRFAGKGSAP